MLDLMACMRMMGWMALVKPLSDQLRHLVQHCGYTRYELSKQLGIEQSALSRFVHGQRGLSLAAVDKLSVFLELRLVSPRERKRRS